MASTSTNSERLVFKIMSKLDWKNACNVGVYHGSLDDLRDGFIHFSADDQIAATAAKYFAGQGGLVVIALRARDLGSALKWEVSRGGTLFPHLYGPLATKDAVFVCPLEIDQLGQVILPMRVAP